VQEKVRTRRSDQGKGKETGKGSAQKSHTAGKGHYDDDVEENEETEIIGNNFANDAHKGTKVGMQGPDEVQEVEPRGDGCNCQTDLLGHRDMDHAKNEGGEEEDIG